MPTIALDRVRVPKEKEVAVPKKEIPLIDFDDMEELYIECLKTNSNNNYVYKTDYCARNKAENMSSMVNSAITCASK